VLVDQFTHLPRALPAALAGAEFGTNFRQRTRPLADDGANLAIGYGPANADDHGLAIDRGCADGALRSDLQYESFALRLREIGPSCKLRASPVPGNPGRRE